MKLKRIIKRLKHFIDSKRSGLRKDGEFIVGGMATMPTRKDSFERSIKSILRQVDKLYLYLDGHDEIPLIVKNNARVVAILSRDCPGLHANGKFLGLALEDKPCLYASFDDDIYYPHDYIAKLRRGLSKQNDHAIVGLHGTRLARPFEGYYKKRKFIGTYNIALPKDQAVDVLGTGAVLFPSKLFQFDVRKWPHVSMADLGLAIEAAKKGIPLISIARKNPMLASLATNQADSLIVARQRDSTLQDKLASELLLLRKQNDKKRSSPTDYP